MLKIIPIKAFSDNYIWVIVRNKKDCIIIDPGHAQVVLNFLTQKKIQLAAILITHHHNDHTGGVKTLLAHDQNIPVYGPENSPFNLITHRLKNDNKIKILDINFSIIATPGHTLDHICYYNEEHQWLFCGDTLFSAGCGRVFEGTMEQMYHSISKLSQLPDSVNIYPAHEYTLNNLYFSLHIDTDNPIIQQAITTTKNYMVNNHPSLPSNIGYEKQINPFLKTKHFSQNHSLFLGKTPIDIFTQLRIMKNNFIC